MQIINDLFNGNIRPLEQILPRSEEYHRLAGKVGDEIKYFQNRLCGEDAKRFEQLQSLNISTFALQEETAFCYGFRLGAAMLAAVYAEPFTLQ